MRRAAITLAGMLAVTLAWYTWRAREIPVVPKSVPPARQTIENEARFESESESESTASNAQDPVSNSPDTSLAPLHADESTGESSAPTVGYSDSPIFITKELPSYLNFYAAQRDPDSPVCMNPFDLLDEMKKLERNEAWATRTEKNLNDLLAPHPLGFPVTITCGGGICQITELGPLDKVVESNIEYEKYWGEFGQRLYRVEPIASELATFSYVAAPYPGDTSQGISGVILTTKARVISAESLDCPSLNFQKANE